MASWFYLTLWRGSPPEFTSDADVLIETMEDAAAGIQLESNCNVSVSLMDSCAALIEKTTNIDIDVITKTEVVWLVGGA
jgi:hypothetical protein